ncbi:STT3 domain-containing protein [Methanococcus voltae]|uniref:dolichyl-phosphooligosaccharide-protein glycotransferase n=1 Tax=Methanococcus voltae (strain ATCC BAA-1334 / A3) TaxID=456320 RepID=D7DU85_METV3|nr:STT3 domain-containing protein [Methanococcus voltae]MCS3900495.1 dolichyl-diphosphooligosaccharide--protein glycosyltransferase [Methanococcus voltae]
MTENNENVKNSTSATANSKKFNFNFQDKKVKCAKTILIIIFLAFLSFQMRAQTADMSFTTNEQYLDIFSDDNGRMYLTALDPYYYLRMSEDYLEYGHTGDTLKDVNGQEIPWDSYKYGPTGAPATFNLINVLTVGVYQIWHSMDSTVTLMNAAFWVPAILSMFIVIPIFFIVRRITSSDIGGAVAAILTSLSPSIFVKTIAGFADTPVLEILPLLFIVWFIIEAMHYSKDKSPKSLLFGLLATIMLVAYPFMWSAWWYGYYIIIAFLVLYLIYKGLIYSHDAKYNKDNKNKNSRSAQKVEVENLEFLNTLKVAGLFVIGGAIAITALYGTNTIMGAFEAPLNYIGLDEVSSTSGWPNVLTTVSELDTASFDEMVSSSLSSIYLFAIGLVGIFLSLFRKVLTPTKQIVNGLVDKIDVKYALLLVIWLAVTFWAASKGVRFVALMVPPLSIGVGIFTGFIEQFIKNNLDKKYEYVAYPTIAIIALYSLYSTYKADNGDLLRILFPSDYVPIAEGIMLASLALLIIYKIADMVSESNKKLVMNKLFMILLAIGLITPTMAAIVPFYSVPTYNDGWGESLEWINTQTPNNSVITCWWDNGHIYTWKTERMVTFDGSTQNTPRAYWVGRAFATSDESLSNGIFRMLASSGDKAYNSDSVLIKKTGSIANTVDVLNEILPLTKTEAEETLKNSTYKFTDTEISEILDATHPEITNPDYLITYNRMTSIASVWSYFGNWNFSLPADTSRSEREAGSFEALNTYATTMNDTLVVRSLLQQTNDYSIYALIEVNNETLTGAMMAVSSDGQIQTQQLSMHKVKLMVSENGETKMYNTLASVDGELSLLMNVNKNSIIGTDGSGNPVYTTNSWITTKNLEDSVYSKLHFFNGEGLETMKLEKASTDPTATGVQPGFKVFSVDYGNYSK